MKEKTKAVALNIAKLKVRVSTNYVRYYNYLSLYFDKIILPQDFERNVEIDINACWQSGSWGDRLAELRRSGNLFDIGADTLIDKNRIATIRKIGKKKKVLFDFKTEDKRCFLKTIMRRKIFKDALRYTIFGRPQEDWFFSVTFPILYYPVFWYQEYFLHTHMLHASAIEFKGKGVVICGLEGIGKTSLTLSLLQDENVRFISDNLVVYDSERIYPCYELIRIHKNEDSSLWRGKFEKVNKFRSLKGFFKPVFELKREGVKPNIFIFPHFDSSFFIREISKHEAINRAIILSQLPAELSNYNEFRKLYNLLDLHFNPDESQYKVLGDLLNTAHCYMVGMVKSDGLEKNSRRLKDFIENGR